MTSKMFEIAIPFWGWDDWYVAYGLNQVEFVKGIKKLTKQSGYWIRDMMSESRNKEHLMLAVNNPQRILKIRHYPGGGVNIIEKHDMILGELKQ